MFLANAGRQHARMRVAHVSATFPPYRGGTGNVCWHHARVLAARGHNVQVFTAAVPNAPARETCDGVVINRLRPVVRVGNAPVLPQLLAALRGFDVVHLHYPFFGGEVTALAAQLWRTPLVVTYHQDVLLHGVLGWVERALRHTVGRMTLRTAARLLFTSDDYCQASYTQSLLRDREARVAAVPNGVDTVTFCPGATGTQRRIDLDLAPDAPVALLVAGLDRAHYFKGVPVFLEALVHMPSVAGVIVGDGDLRAHYEELAQQFGVAARVRFVGRASNEALPEYYRLANVTVLPSVTMGEAFGLVLVESLACGTPVVASNLPGVRTVVDHGKDGLLVKPNDPHALAAAIKQIVADEDQRVAMGTRGRANVVARYDWQQIGVQLEQIYQQVAQGEFALAKRLT